MTAKKSKRGRPKGTGIDDLPALRAMADLIVSEPGLKATTAYKAVNLQWLEKDLRRIQFKWKAQGESLLAEVRDRRSARARPTRTTTADEEISLMKATAQAARMARDMYDSPSMRAARAVVHLPSMRAVRELYDSPSMRAARELYDSPSLRLAREVYDSPAAKLIRDWYDSPEHRLMREVRSMYGLLK